MGEVIREAQLERNESGLAPVTNGWFVVNVADAAWLTAPSGNSACFFENPQSEFEQLGINIRVLLPGKPNGRYHSESVQEDFLVLAGECLLLIEEQERPLKAWDVVHCPPGANHIFVGAADGPCVILMMSNREPNATLHYPRSELALRYGAGVETPTDSAEEAYAGLPPAQVARPPYWDELPWAARA
jgi:uncharacterized cupin superfamily protein